MGWASGSAFELESETHALAGAEHTAAGLTAGHVLRAASATTFAFAQLAYADLTGTHDSTAHSVTYATLAGNTFTGVQQLPNGSAGSPALTFSAEVGLDTGIYRVAADQLGITAGGTLRLTVASTGIVASQTIFAGTDNTYDIGSAGALRFRDMYLARDLEIDGALNHDGTTVGFFGTAPVTRPSLSGAIVDNVGGTPSDTWAAIPNPADAPLTADALRDDLVANVLPVIRNLFSSAADKIQNDIAGALISLGLATQ